MTRTRHFLNSLFAGYASFGANFLFTFVSVPLALHYLPKEEFGLWSLVLQIAGYLMLIDLGMTSSVARFLANYKDNMESGDYGNVLRTGHAIFLIQATCLAFVSWMFAKLLPSYLDLPSSLQPVFGILMISQGVIQAVSLATRSFGSPLWAHQRQDITSWIATAGLLISLAAQWLGFIFGVGIYSLLISQALGATIGWVVPFLVCRHLHLYPSPNNQGHFRYDLFFRMFHFGRDLLLMQLGGLLCSGSQIIVVTKTLGLEAAAVFSVATKALTMGQQLIGKILENSAPGLTEIYVQGDHKRFAVRFYQMTTISISAATALALGLMGANRIFVSFWTHDLIHWTPIGDALLGALLITTVATRCLQGSFGMSGDVSKVRFLSLGEGILFIGLSLAGGVKFGLHGILAFSLLSQIAVSLIGAGIRTGQSFPWPFFWKTVPWCISFSYVVSAVIFLWIAEFFVPTSTQILTTFILIVMMAFFLLKMLVPILRGQL